MTTTDGYLGLARLLDYPEDREALLASYDVLADHLAGRGLASPAAVFRAFVEESTLAQLQEDYVANFDFNPATAPYLGHHLYGDNQKKGAYMIRVKKEYIQHEFDQEGCELPDHLAVLLSFVSHLSGRGEELCRRRFVEELVLPGLQKLVAGQARNEGSPWLTLMEAALTLCSADCEEVSTC